MKERTINCPYCKKPSIYSESNPYRPFCSERCKMIDLGDWADEKYKVPTEEKVDPDSYRKEDDGDLQ